MLLFLATAAQAAECDAAALEDAVKRAETAFTEMEADPFTAAEADAEKALACMTTSLTPVQIAGYHRVLALQSFFAQDDATTILHLQAVLGSQPGYELPEAIAPDGHPLREDLEKARGYLTSDTFDLPEPEEGWLTIDGKRGLKAPAGRSWILQRFDAAGAVAQTAYVAVNAPTPTYPVKPEPAPEPAPQPAVEEPSGGGGGKSALLYTGIGVAVVGAGLYGAAFATRGSYNDAVDAGNRAKIESTHGTTNALVISSIAGLGAGGALVVVGAL